MRDISGAIADLPRQQQSIRARCVHPTNTFIEFKKEDIERSVPERFEQQARQYPDRLAVKTRYHEVTYRALNETANRVARAILALRGEGEEPIALLFEQGAPAIASILGVLKAGKIYVPLDPSAPRARTLYMLEDSRPGLIITDSRHLPLADHMAKNLCPLLDVDELDSSRSPENPGLSLSPETLASIIYTSGSTGRPKGVVQNHRNVLHFIMNYTNGIHICSNDRLTLLFSCSVVGAVRDMLSALLNGAALYPLDLKEAGLASLATWLIQEEITIYHSVATVFRHFIGALSGAEDFPMLRLVYLGGEPVHKRDVELYTRHFSRDCLFLNGLSTTETGTTRMYFVDKETPIPGPLVPVGYAVEDTEVLLFDDTGRRAGFNSIGEITIKSRYCALGYWRKPDLTRAAFLPDVAGGDERIYRTGDLGCMLPDDCLVHLGRKDFQVKVRGHRIEVAEIEMALLDHAAIEEAVVLSHEDGQGDTRLVAYLVPARHPVPAVAEMRRFVQEKLPDYMVPAVFMMVDTLPRAPNGKVDRRALPAPDSAGRDLEGAIVAPRTPIEAELVRIWASVLGREEMGIHDHFLELGGHSLLAMQIVSRVRDSFHVEVPLAALVETPTVADMAMLIAQHTGAPWSTGT